MNEVLHRQEEDWEYVGHDLSYKEFKAQVNVYLKNRRHALKLLIKVNLARPKDYTYDHWENMKRLIAQGQNKGKLLDIVPCKHKLTL
jgi:hypothetical protein